MWLHVLPGGGRKPPSFQVLNVNTGSESKAVFTMTFLQTGGPLRTHRSWTSSPGWLYNPRQAESQRSAGRSDAKVRRGLSSSALEALASNRKLAHFLKDKALQWLAWRWTLACNSSFSACCMDGEWSLWSGESFRLKLFFSCPGFSSLFFSPPFVGPDRVRRPAQVGIYGMWAPPLVSWSAVFRCSQQECALHPVAPSFLCYQLSLSLLPLSFLGELGGRVVTHERHIWV